MKVYKMYIELYPSWLQYVYMCESRFKPLKLKWRIQLKLFIPQIVFYAPHIHCCACIKLVCRENLPKHILLSCKLVSPQLPAPTSSESSHCMPLLLDYRLHKTSALAYIPEYGFKSPTIKWQATSRSRVWKTKINNPEL